MEQRTDPAADESPPATGEDPQGLRTLLARNHDRLRAITERLLGQRLRHRVNVSDIVQSCLVDLIRSFRGFRDTGEGAFEAWSRRVLENGVRRKSRYYRAQKRADEDEDAAPVEDRAGPEPTPSHHAVNAEDLARLERAMAQLPVDQREIIRLHVIEGRPHDDVARLTGRSPAATRMMLSRARARLSVEIDRLDHDHQG